MKRTDIIGLVFGCLMAVGGFIGLAWKAIEMMVYRFSNPDQTQMRAVMENTDIVIAGLISAGICYIGAKIAVHYSEK